MRHRPPRVLDSSAIIALFNGHPALDRLLDLAERGRVNLLMPTTAIADAEAVVQHGTPGWEPILLTGGVRSLPLAEHTAIEIGGWPGDLAVRHAVHEADASRAAVVTTEPGMYKGLRVFLLVV
ncbi:hypothetical protein ACTMTJ_21450 [Phytohabitans sp. LJ34]|uniref:hypothetical protein n=1 Tax=Phytohabitans sp. LJ34 TaxID=3452217 RepID=UPI003F8A09E5